MNLVYLIPPGMLKPVYDSKTLKNLSSNPTTSVFDNKKYKQTYISMVLICVGMVVICVGMVVFPFHSEPC